MAATRTLLIVDDEDLFTRSLAEGLATMDPPLRVLTAPSGRAARALLEEQEVDLILTDLRMTDGDGFELIAFLNNRRPDTPVLVMTAFGTPEIGRQLKELGVDGFIEKPVEFAELAARLHEVLESSRQGFVSGIALATVLQIIDMERRTCTLRVRTGDAEGILHFVQGVLHDAATATLTGEDAAREIVGWDRTAVEIRPGGRAARRIETPLGAILLECFKARDERAAARPASVHPTPASRRNPTDRFDRRKENDDMSVQEKLKELASIEGFLGVGIYTPTGESLASLSNGTAFPKEIGVLANNVLMNAQKASLEMGAGRGQQVHIEGEKAAFIARCKNEGTDPLRSQPGKAHIHVVLALSDDSSIGMAKLRLTSMVEKLAEDFRL